MPSASTAIGLVMFVCLFGGSFGGVLLRRVLPEHHQTADTLDVPSARAERCALDEPLHLSPSPQGCLPSHLMRCTAGGFHVPFSADSFGQ